jgi:flagellar biosynthesis protein FlhF
MMIKRYLANDMNEAMARIKYELGSDAIIISSRWIRKKGLRNLFSKKVLEVTAAVDQPDQTARNDSKEIIHSQIPVQNTYHAQLEKEIKELRDMVSKLLEKEKARQRGGRKVQFSIVMKRHLSDMDLDEEIIKDFDDFCKSEGSANIDYDRASQYFEKKLKKSVRSRNKMKSHIWAFIGPTGVGKTTTIAKLAAKETLEKRKKVGLITMDTFRIGAVEQLKTYADILSLPLEVVSTREEMAEALKKLEACDLILIDSTGRNSQAKEQLLEIKECLGAVEKVHNILVMSAATRRADVKLILENYQLIGYDSVILTKLDETMCYGNILNINHYTDKPLSYLTTGQIVPEDIKKATMESLLEYVFMGVNP